MTRFPGFLASLLFLALTSLPGASAVAGAGRWDIVIVKPVKTSIYVGSVTLNSSDFKRDGEIYRATYEAKVWPWFFWSEQGSISIALPQAELERLERGERVDFKGHAENHKKKPRHISGWAQRENDAAGKIKVRIGVDDTELVFNTTYRFGNVAK